MSGGYVETFRTHANYLRAFGLLCSAPYESGIARPFAKLSTKLSCLAPVIASSPSMSAPASAQPDLAQAQASLRNAWGTELLLALGGQVATDEELQRVVNNWAVVQTYYVGYHAVQALLVARGQPRPESHPKTQAQFATLWADRSLDLPPWTFGARDGGWCNPPSSPVIDDGLNPWSACESVSCWSLAGKALRTTRKEFVDDRMSDRRDRKRQEAKKAWRQEESERLGRGGRARKEPQWPRPLLTADEKRDVASKVRTYTLLDYLYRLRIKTNYEDAGMFIDGPEDETSSGEVHRNLVLLASGTLLVHELHIAAIVGRTKLLQWVDSWLVSNTGGQKMGLALRRDLLAAHAPETGRCS